ncbi:S8 family serine peptidase [Streptomyces sp. SID12488]|uniref:S8 family serine peptidase n=1 Tax=Streptomyces sp. SID12488 TaxID=2706040 RepID=UPI001EF1D2BA|nr:S8 family serine peptidase [Streptomyces sp. SID12488]
MKYRFVRPVLAAAVVLPFICVPAVAEAADGPGVTLLPPLPLRLGADSPCTAASKETATAAAWSQITLGLSRAQRISRGAGVTVAVVDTGVSTGVPSLSGRVTALGGADEDCVGHGTFAAGLIAAAPETGSGITGVAPEARIVALRGTDDRGVPSVQRVALGIRTAADRGARVIYVGHALDTGKAELTDAVAYAAGHDALVVAPAAPDSVPKEELGPDGAMPEGPYWPAAAPGVLAVVDFGPSGVRQQHAPPAYEPDLSAPGSSMVSVGPKGSGHYIGSGASLAAAVTAGAAALVRAYHPGMSAAEVSARLLATSYPSDTPRLDPYAALSVVPEEGEVAAGQQAPAHFPEPADAGPRNRALAIAGAGLAVALLVAALAAVLPRGRARNWLPPGRQP